MTELKTGAAYIRKSTTSSTGADSSRSDTEHEVLALLRTAHTAESLSRRLSRERNVEAGTLQQEVESAMRRLLDAELIELSPDS